MNKRIQLLHDFFHAYASRFTHALKDESPDIDGTVTSFAECFTAASPSGVTCGKNNEDFKTAISQGYAFYKTIGVRSMEIVFLETTILDGFHEMTKIRWNCGYAIKKDNSKGNIEFENFYFTHTKEHEPKIFAYITGDEQAALKEHGLI